MDHNNNIILIIREELTERQREINNYNSIFISSTVLTSVLTVAATILTSSNINSDYIIFLICVLPMIYFLSLYNLIKYTTEQMRLCNYCRKLEYKINSILEDKILYWELEIKKNAKLGFWGGTIQLIFYIPLAIILSIGFYKIKNSAIFSNHMYIWYIILIILLLQSLAIVAMCIRLIIVIKHINKEIIKDD